MLVVLSVKKFHHGLLEYFYQVVEGLMLCLLCANSTQITLALLNQVVFGFLVKESDKMIILS